MTTEKKLKRQKLRNAEYYDFQAIQDELYERSKRNEVFTNLVELITMRENIGLAYRNIKKNKGSKTAGVDKKTIDDLAKWQDEQLIDYVRARLQCYKPQAVRRVEILKDNDATKKRPLGIPTIMERLIQQCILQVLEPICEAKFFERSNGFRPNRSTEHAISQAHKYMQNSGLHFVIDIDIRAFFDNVNHAKLIKQLWTMGIRDKKLLSIISEMLKAEIAGIGFPEQGSPQGSVISPLFSNVVLNELDWWIASQWETIPTQHRYNLKYKGAKYTALRRTNLKECYIVRYADDFKIFCRKRSDAVKLFKATKQWLMDRLGLEISPEKSKIVNLKRHYSNFLGFRLKLHKKGKKKNGEPRYTVKSHISKKAEKKIKDKTHELVKEIQKPQGMQTGYEAVNKYNAYVIGVHNYYAIATLVSVDFNQIAFGVKKSLKARLKDGIKRAGKDPPKYIKERYGSSKELRYIYGTAIVPLAYIRHRVALYKKKGINKYTKIGREEIHKRLECVDIDMLMYLMRNPEKGQSIEYNDNRLSLYAAQKGKCAVTGAILEFETMYCHHKKPLVLGGEDKYKNLILVTKAMHELIHEPDKSKLKLAAAALLLDKRQVKKLIVLNNLAVKVS
ncbi:group II intron reverse transcriptase/maturase [Desulfosporosinus metallidurans]|uniref:Retron-type RNA-directed DNA polymerase n=1 Tax=Desulfosporosinus metallidurans TaxID=1888891 RepID=A0A1Q8QCX5_9FIRM|nr:group II intron reverse transcriptase/maturase [Desulfosporosinus metallidurans]OLN25151.1 Retron-type RNA-directed DNA polymerase [Desulfosporosinus metallidurans]